MLRKESLEYIAQCIQIAGCDPNAQLRGYLKTGNILYITRTGGARELIIQFSRLEIENYLKTKYSNGNSKTDPDCTIQFPYCE